MATKKSSAKTASAPRLNVEYILSVCAEGGVAHSSHPSLEALDEAFWDAVKTTPLPESPDSRSTDGQVSANTYGKISGQGIGKSHAYRLVDGRIFQRPLDRWNEAEMEPVSPDDPRLATASAPAMG